MREVITILCLALSFCHISGQQTVSGQDTVSWIKIGETTVEFQNLNDEILVNNSDKYAFVRFQPKNLR